MNILGYFFSLNEDAYFPNPSSIEKFSYNF